MREILFRGKRIDNGEWVYGNFVKGCVDDFAYIVEFGNKDLCRNFVEVIPETVGQYTGLTDKNGKKIFEGDILDGLCGLHIVYFDDSFACFDWENAIGKQSESFSGFADDYEVIGNIYDNKEILDVK